jgi:hypothetical protein
VESWHIRCHPYPLSVRDQMRILSTGPGSQRVSKAVSSDSLRLIRYFADRHAGRTVMMVVLLIIAGLAESHSGRIGIH